MPEKDTPPASLQGWIAIALLTALTGNGIISTATQRPANTEAIEIQFAYNTDTLKRIEASVDKAMAAVTTLSSETQDLRYRLTLLETFRNARFGTNGDIDLSINELRRRLDSMESR